MGWSERQSLAAVLCATLGCNSGLSAGSPFDGGPPVSDASCPVPCGRGQVCEYPGAIGDGADAALSTSPSCVPMPEACTSNQSCGCLWTALCDGADIGVACTYNPSTGYWFAQCIAN
jgi:hypothetical protein